MPHVDIGTGEVRRGVLDYRRDGLLPLCIARYYSSHDLLRRPYFRAAGEEAIGGFGMGWRAGWDHSLRRTLRGYIYAPPDGSEIELRSGLDGRVQHVGHRLELEGIDPHRVRLVEYPRGRSPISYVFVASDGGARWALEAIEYRQFHRIVLTRDAAGRVVRLEHTRARCAVGVSYGNEHVVRLELHTPQGGRHFMAAYQYDPRGLLIEVLDRVGRAVSYAYDNDNRLTREEKREGGTFVLDYDREGRCARIGGAKGGYHTRLFSYDPLARRTRVSNGSGESWLYELDMRGRVALAVSPLGREEAFEFDAAGHLARRVDPAGRETLYYHDEQGHLYGRKNPEGTTYWEYDPWHRVTERIGSRGELIVQYNEEHDLIGIGRPDALWTFGHNVHGERTSVRNPNGATRSMLYDEFGNRTAEGDFQGNYTHYEYDDFGRCIKITNPLGGVEERAIDDLDRVVSSTRSGTLSRSLHDGESSHIEDASGTKKFFRRDPYGRTLEHADTDGIVARLRWGTEPGQLLGVTVGAAKEETFHYDADQRPVEVHTRDGRLLAIEYNELGPSALSVRTSLVPPTGSVMLRRTSLERDGQGRLIRATSGDQERRFEYDHAGRLLRAETDHIVLTRTYDDAGRCTAQAVEARHAETGQDRLISHVHATLDALGRTVGWLSGRAPEVMFEWDENSRVAIVDFAGVRVRYARDASGAEVERSSPGMRLLIKRDREGRESEWLYDIDGEPPARLQASYGSRHESPSFLSITTAHGEQAALVRYDGRGRIRALVWQGEGRMSRFFAYDGEGDWSLHGRTLRGTDLLPRIEAAGWDRAPLILSHYAEELSYATARPGGRLETIRAGTVTVRYVWDDLGRAIEKVVCFGDDKDVWRYEYDAWDALRRVETPRGVSYAYRYDALGRLIERRSSDGMVTELVWDTGGCILHILVDGKLTETRVHHTATGELLFQRFSDGSVDVRPSRLRELEELLGSASPGSSVEPSATLPRLIVGVGPFVARPLESSFYDSEARVAISICRCWDLETAYDLTWQRGERVDVPTPGVFGRPDPIDGAVERGAATLLEDEAESPTVFMSEHARAVLAELL